MSEKTHGTKNNSSNTHENSHTTSELDQLREIVFGDAKRTLEQQQQQMFAQLQQQITELGQNLNNNLDESFSALQKEVQQVDKKASIIDSDHHDRADQLKSEIEQLNHELAEHSEQNNRDLQHLQASISKNIASLSADLQQQIENLVADLAKMSADLDSSKTDRKQLAQLFNVVALNLEQDDASQTADK